MKFNLKNRPKYSPNTGLQDWYDWFEGFEKELREIVDGDPWVRSAFTQLAKEILGE